MGFMSAFVEHLVQLLILRWPTRLSAIQVCESLKDQLSTLLLFETEKNTVLASFISDCFTGSDFLCQNHRCISNQLNCDGFDHCGDNSDEPATCTRGNSKHKFHTLFNNLII